MNAKEFLQQIEKLDRLIENKMAEAQQWRDIANNTTVNMSGEKVSSSGSHDIVANAICKYMDLDAEIAREIDKLIAARKDVIGVIEQLSAAEYDILHKHYVQGFTFGDLAITYDCSYSGVTSRHNRALKSVQKILDIREERLAEIKALKGEICRNH